jgi:hypothetical protein
MASSNSNVVIVLQSNSPNFPLAMPARTAFDNATKAIRFWTSDRTK